MDPLTQRQKQVWQTIESYRASHGEMPSLRQLAQLLGIRSPNGVLGHLKALEKKGYLHRKKPRTSPFTPSATQRGIPLVATVPAGTPQQTFDQTEQFIDLEDAYFGKGTQVAIQISGESMAGDAIADGDVGIIALGNQFKPKDILAVRVGSDEVTLKRIRKEGPIIVLVPSNPDYPERRVPAEEINIIGKLIGIIRKT